MSLLKSSLKKKMARMNRPLEPSPIYVYGSDEPFLFSEKSQAVMLVSSKFKHFAQILKKSACQHRIVSLSFNQIFMEYRAFTYYQGIRNGFSKWHCGEDKKIEDFKLIINPQITHVKREMVEDWEFCPSFPYLRAKIPRFSEIKVTYSTEENEERSENISGFFSRVFQHEFDHLQGSNILDWRVSFGNLELLEEAKTDFPTLAGGLRNLNEKMKEMREKFPNVFNFYNDDMNFKKIEGEDGDWYEVDYERLRSQEPFSIEEEVYGKIERAAVKDYHLTMKKLEEKYQFDEELKKFKEKK